ncbi:hypothetical protein B0H17DRAFT_1329292 [Mycena rosella]|uniref:Uncharacterized protein n=1 Tax=Mycena rosella TaxID=1033263 RepID=A0AAD7DNX3_MYCRO|nr:hypothetical protein B0H17DRAFT_1329292 [Mycena rosella]
MSPALTREGQFEVSIPHVAYAALGGFVVLFGMFSLLLREKLYIGERCWEFLFSVVFGPYDANIFNPRAGRSAVRRGLPGIRSR